MELRLDSGVAVKLGRLAVTSARALHPAREPARQALGGGRLRRHALHNGSASAGTRVRRRRRPPEDATQMPKKFERNLIVGLDIGTRRCGDRRRARPRRHHRSGRRRLAPVARLKKGVVVNIDSTVHPSSAPRGSGTDGRLRDPLRVRRHRGQPRALAHSHGIVAIATRR